MAKLTKRIKKKIETYCELYGKEIGDLKGLWDSNLTVEENLRNLGLPDDLMKVDYVKKAKEEERKHKVRLINETIQYANKKLEESIQKILNENITDIEPYYKKIFTHIDLLLDKVKIKGIDEKRGLIILGKRGIGKTRNTISYLEKRGYSEKKGNLKIVRGHTTPLTLYRILYENSDKLIIFDDIPRDFLANPDVISLFLGALDNTTAGVIEWNSNSPLADDLPNRFVFEGKIIFILNGFPENKALEDYIEALKDRCIICKFSLSDNQLIEIGYIMSKKYGVSLEVMDYFKMLVKTRTIKNLSLRLIKEAFRYYLLKKDEWRQIIKEHMEFDKDKELILTLLKKFGYVKDAVRKWTELTGMGRATFYRKYKELREILNDEDEIFRF